MIPKTGPNNQVEAVLPEYTDLLAVTDGNWFKARAYERVAHIDIFATGAGLA